MESEVRGIPSLATSRTGAKRLTSQRIPAEYAFGVLNISIPFQWPPFSGRHEASLDWAMKVD